MSNPNTPESNVKESSNTQGHPFISKGNRLLERYDEYLPLGQLFPGLFLIFGILGGSIAIVVFYSILQSAPPSGELSFTVQNYLDFVNNSFYVSIFLESFLMGTIVTIGCLAVAFPLAYKIAFMESEYKNFFLILCILPFWINLVVRTYAWQLILAKNGIINYILMDLLGVIDQPLQLLFTDFSVFIGLLHVFLPFAIIPLYTSIDNIDRSHIEAAKDLGSNNLQAFYEVTLPQALPGIGASSIIVFVLASGSFVVPDLLGGSNVPMIGNIIADMFTVNFSWELGSAIAIMFTVTILVIVYIYNRVLGLEELYGSSGGEA